MGSVQGELAIDSQRRTVLVELPAYPVVPDAMTAAIDAGFTAKPEFHLTVAGFGTIKRLLASVPEGERDEAFARVAAIAQGLDWSIAPMRHYLRMNKTDDGRRHDDPAERSSVIEMVTCPAMDTFYDALRAMFPNAELATPPPHVTLATRHDHKGIAVRSAEDLTAFAVPFAVAGRGALGR